MADIDDFDYEFKEEELVDFEGSDYGFGSDEELDLENGGNALLSNQVPADVPPMTSGDRKEESRTEREKAGISTAAAPAKTAAMTAEAVALKVEKRDGAESGEIEDDREEKDGGVAAQSVSSLSSLAYREGFDHEGKSYGDSGRRQRKADLEDGELDDAAMPEGSDNDAAGTADGDDEDENDQRERKRRKGRFVAERRSQKPERIERESGFLVATAASKHRSGGSDRQMDRSGGLSKTLSAGGQGMQMGGFGQGPNMAPGIMGPGGPFVPFDIGATISLRQVGRGLVGPVGGIPVPGGVSMSHFRGAVAVHEHMIRSHRMMQHIAAGGPGRSVPGPLGAFCRRPMVDLGGHLSRGMLHLQPRVADDVASQVSFASAINPQRNPRISYGSCRGPFGQATGHMGSSPRSNSGRRGSWSVGSMQGADVHAVGRGRDEGRGHGGPPLWVDPQRLAVAQNAAVQAGVAPGLAQGVSVGYMIGQRVMGAGTPRLHQGLPDRKGIANNEEWEADGTWRINGARSNAVQNVRSAADNKRLSGSATGIKRERETDLGKHLNASNSHAATNFISVGGGANTATNLIQLGGPVPKSSRLTVSGLPENTSMSVVVEAFEKQGKIMDFKKEQNGGAFTITFSNISEAISAKRHMHRSTIAGRQVTVEYAVQCSNSR